MNGVRSRTRRMVYRSSGSSSLFFRMALNTYTLTAIQIWVLTAFSEVPRNRWMRRCCFHGKFPLMLGWCANPLNSQWLANGNLP